MKGLGGGIPLTDPDNTRDYIRCLPLQHKQGFLTDWAEDFIRAVWTLLLPVTGVRDVNTASVVTFELVL